MENDQDNPSHSKTQSAKRASTKLFILYFLGLGSVISALGNDYYGSVKYFHIGGLLEYLTTDIRAWLLIISGAILINAILAIRKGAFRSAEVARVGALAGLIYFFLAYCGMTLLTSVLFLAVPGVYIFWVLPAIVLVLVIVKSPHLAKQADGLQNDQMGQMR